MIDFIIGAVVGALAAWFSFFVVVYPALKSVFSEVPC